MTICEYGIYTQKAIKNSIANQPIGYRSDPETKKLHVVPEEAELVRKIFETYLRFGSGKETAKFLDLCGLKTPVKVSRKQKLQNLILKPCHRCKRR